MHRAKHRAADRPSAADSSAVLATTLLERFAVVPGPRTAPAGARAATRAPAGGHALFGAAPRTGPMVAVDVDDAPAGPAPLFRSADDPDSRRDDTGPLRTGESPLFGAARHARSRSRGAAAPAVPAVPAPRVPAAPPAPAPSPRPRTQPVGATLSVTVLGAAAAVTAVVAPPPTAVESTGSMAPVQVPAPFVGPVAPVAPALAAPAAANALPDQPTLQVDDHVTQVTGDMQKVEDRPYTTVAQAEKTSSPAAMRKAAMTNALAKLGRPYRWGAMGPNAFDCSGLVKWSFASAGRSLPRTSRAMATVGVRVAKADLQPGDLVFFYQPISHVGIYIGNGKIVHASRSGQPVKISDMSRMRFTTARRVA
jgi:peptidoglycan DL-endopeptidase CwlO